MKTRCLNPNSKDYMYYGGRGIKVCDRWLSFENFKNDLALLPGTGSDLDRVDSNGDYSPENCKWSTREENVRNTRRAKMITWQGRTQHYIDWAAELGIKPETLRSRVFRRNLPLDVAMTKKVSA